ncbi:MAG TPA: alpha-L-fucosidase, partial [Lysobacter sp.]|nr:alpha-L-fucosidase [Lysobacter sp.]
MKKLVVLLLAAVPPVLAAEPVADSPQSSADQRMEWFRDAKFGVFIHWGIYAVDGIDESWSFFNGYISHDDYMKQRQGFNASRYDPQAWADLIKESGARYAVLTSKHHDGVALWDSRQG